MKHNIPTARRHYLPTEEPSPSLRNMYCSSRRSQKYLDNPSASIATDDNIAKEILQVARGVESRLYAEPTWMRHMSSGEL